jgi:hypothetical protein
VEVTAPVTLDFSELMRHPTLTADRLRLRPEGSGSAVGAALGVTDQPDPDGAGPAVPFTRVTVTPDAPLPSDTLVVTLAGVETCRPEPYCDLFHLPHSLTRCRPVAAAPETTRDQRRGPTSSRW